MNNFEELTFYYMLVFHLTVGVLYHSVYREFLLILGSDYITTRIYSTSPAISMSEFMVKPIGLSWNKQDTLASYSNFTLYTTSCIGVDR